MYPRCGAVSFPGRRGTLWFAAAASGGPVHPEPGSGRDAAAVPQFPQPSQRDMGAEPPHFRGIPGTLPALSQAPTPRLGPDPAAFGARRIVLLGKDPREYGLQPLTRHRHPRAGGWWHLELLDAPAVRTGVLYPVNARAGQSPPGISPRPRRLSHPASPSSHKGSISCAAARPPPSPPLPLALLSPFLFFFSKNKK